MSHQWMRCNLSTANFPFASKLWGRSIIVPQYDENYDRTLASTADQDKDKGVPQVFYMHNCMPTPQGFQSIGYDVAIQAAIGAPTDFDSVFGLQNVDLSIFLFVPALGKNYIYDKNVAAWNSVSPLPPGTINANTIVTTAFVHGQSYIYYQNIGCYKYDDIGRVMTNVTLVGLTATAVKGICAANGYMIAWNDTTVSWSNSQTETDFVPSLITGAGGGAVADAKGRIICCLPISGGFLIYCEKNVVAARYTSNIRFPYLLSELPGSGGIAGPEVVSWQSNLAQHYAWTSAGLQLLDTSKTTLIAPEVTDFIGAQIFEDFDETTFTFLEEYLASQLFIKLSVIGERYVVISYGVSSGEYTHALVFDLSLKRYGKLKILHRDSFEWTAPSLTGTLTYGQLSVTYGALGTTTYGDLLVGVSTPAVAKKTLAFLQKDGTIQIVDFSLAQVNGDGILILGKFQFQRNKFIVHQTSDIENVILGYNFKFFLLPTLDGKTFLSAVFPMRTRASPDSVRYQRRLTGQNIASGFQGAFNLTTYLIDFTVGGDR